MHLHGHDFLLLAEGKGVFTESVLTTVNFTNPTRRDVVTMPVSDPTSNITGGYIVIAFPLNNPGVWVTNLKVVSDCSYSIVISLGTFRWV
jgi:FtsP/CotA-like multicopper oxidase with cupredoxin domain